MKNPFLTISMLSVHPECAAVVPASFAGTKWNQTVSFLGEHNTLEFVDDTTCVYTFYDEPETHTYKVTGDKIVLAGDTYVFKKQGEVITSDLYTGALKNDTLMLLGNPFWAKAE